MTGKRRGHGEGSLFQRADGRWAASVNLGWRNGKRVRRTYYGRTRKEAVDKLTAARRAMEAGVDPGRERVTVGAFLADWLEAKESTIRATTWQRYRGIVRTHLVPHLGRISLSKLSPADVERMLRDMDGSPRTRSHARAVLRTALQRAVAHGLIVRNPAALAAPPRVAQREEPAWDGDQARRFLASVKGHRLEALFTLALYTGMRQGEIIGLRWSDIDLVAGTLSVKRSLQRVEGVMVPLEPKTERSRRTIPLAGPVLEALAAHRTAQDGPIASMYVFTAPSGGPLYPTAVYREFIEAAAAAGLPRVRFHSLRHTAGSLLVAAGVHPRVVMEMLGHSTIRLTMDTYSHVMPTQLRDASAVLEAQLGGK